jgi:hypothetical protein
MESVILLNSNENTKQVEEEEKARFTYNVLETLGIPLDDTWDENGELSIQGKIKLRSVLSMYNVQIIDDMGGGLQIYCDKQLIANWNKPSYILKKDYHQIDPRKKLFLEMKISAWSIFEPTE